MRRPDPGHIAFQGAKGNDDERLPPDSGATVVERLRSRNTATVGPRDRIRTDTIAERVAARAPSDVASGRSFVTAPKTRSGCGHLSRQKGLPVSGRPRDDLHVLRDRSGCAGLSGADGPRRDRGPKPGLPATGGNAWPTMNSVPLILESESDPCGTAIASAPRRFPQQTANPCRPGLAGCDRSGLHRQFAMFQPDVVGAGTGA